MSKIVFLFSFVVSIPAMAGGGWWDRGGVTCTSHDNGWEEHWGGHRSCEQCLSKHDNCTETCERIYEFYDCEYVGRFANGETRSFMGHDQDRWNAEREAEYYCRYSGAENCQYRSCAQKSEKDVISRRSCR